MIKTSVVIPVYNTAKYLDQCINSVLNQTQKEFEIILVNDGSTDRSGEIIDRYANEFPFIHAVHQINQKQGAARNVGVRLAKGQYILFLDSDDYIDNNTLTNAYSLAESKRLDFVMFDMTCFQDGCDDAQYQRVLHISEVDRNSFGIHGTVFRGVDFWDRFIMNRGVNSSPCLMYFNSVFFKSHQLWFEEQVYFEDLEWFPRVYNMANAISYMAGYYYHRRIREESTNTLAYNDTHLFSAVKMLGVSISRLVSGDQSPQTIYTFNRFVSLAVEIISSKDYRNRSFKMESSNEIKKLASFLIDYLHENHDNKLDFRIQMMLLIDYLHRETWALETIDISDLMGELSEAIHQFYSKYHFDDKQKKIALYGKGFVYNNFVHIYEKYIGHFPHDVICISSCECEKGSYPVQEIDDIGISDIILCSFKYRQAMIDSLKTYSKNNIRVFDAPFFCHHFWP